MAHRSVKCHLLPTAKGSTQPLLRALDSGVEFSHPRETGLVLTLCFWHCGLWLGLWGWEGLGGFNNDPRYNPGSSAVAAACPPSCRASPAPPGNPFGGWWQLGSRMGQMKVPPGALPGKRGCLACRGGCHCQHPKLLPRAGYLHVCAAVRGCAWSHWEKRAAEVHAGPGLHEKPRPSGAVSLASECGAHWVLTVAKRLCPGGREPAQLPNMLLPPSLLCRTLLALFSGAGCWFDLPWMLSLIWALWFLRRFEALSRWRDVGLIWQGPLCGRGAPEWSCYARLGLAGQAVGCKLGLPLLWGPHWVHGRGSFQGDLLPPKHASCLLCCSAAAPARPPLGESPPLLKLSKSPTLSVKCWMEYTHIPVCIYVLSNIYLYMYKKMCVHVYVYIHIYSFFSFFLNSEPWAEAGEGAGNKAAVWGTVSPGLDLALSLISCLTLGKSLHLSKPAFSLETKKEFSFDRKYPIISWNIMNLFKAMREKNAPFYSNDFINHCWVKIKPQGNGKEAMLKEKTFPPF